MAAILGRTEAGVKKLQARGLAQLRRILAAEDRGAGRPDPRTVAVGASDGAHARPGASEPPEHTFTWA